MPNERGSRSSSCTSCHRTRHQLLLLAVVEAVVVDYGHTSYSNSPQFVLKLKPPIVVQAESDHTADNNHEYSRRRQVRDHPAWKQRSATSLSSRLTISVPTVGSFALEATVRHIQWWSASRPVNGHVRVEVQSSLVTFVQRYNLQSRMNVT